MYSKFLLFCLFLPVTGFTQEPADSIRLKEAVIQVYPVKRFYLNTPASISVLNTSRLNEQSDQSLVSAMNSVAGVKMEERSPGSYRLSIRGSLLRSPFGIRNVKVYFDEFPLTDAGGNTYLNILDAGQVKNIEILKGAEGSLFGANTGGVVLVNSVSSSDTKTATAGVSAGSYGFFHQKAGFKKTWNNYSLSLAQGYQRGNGYRDHSAMQRHYLQSSQQWKYQPGKQVKLLLLFSDLHYQTPGGLTLFQYQRSPRAARPRTGMIPGAGEQQAGIYNTTFFGGLLHETEIKKRLRHVIAFFGGKTDFKNPFITNYEVRQEGSIGIRTYAELKAKEAANISWTWNLGWEGQQTASNISNHQNNHGIIGAIQVRDVIAAREHFFFTQCTVNPGSRWVIEAALSMNNYLYHYKNLFPLAETDTRVKQFKTQFMPRLALSYRLMNTLVWRASVSRGYAPPTIAEVRPSDNNIYVGLEPETGLNYETGFRMLFSDGRFRADAVIFHYQLKNAIVRRVNANNAEYFINAGGTRQPGLELELASTLISSQAQRIFTNLELRTSLTWYDFSFDNYQVASADYSGNPLTGVPDLTLVTGLSTVLWQKFSMFAQHSYMGAISLNDASSAYADPYQIIQLKVMWKQRLKRNWHMELFSGIDNLLNERYSLGNDLNAFGGRYYNAAPLRNYYGGVTLSF